MASSSIDAKFWLISLPGDEKNMRKLQEKTSRYTKLGVFNIPNLKVGTLDKLIELSDSLGKLDVHLNAVVTKVGRSFMDLKQNDALLVEEKSISHYVTHFQWNAAKYSVDLSLKDMTEEIERDMVKMDNDLKKRSSKYHDVITAYTQLLRREQGSMLIQPLSKVIEDPSVLIEKEYLSTILVVVPDTREEEFLRDYEIFEDVVKKSSLDEMKAEAAQNAAAASSSASDSSDVKVQSNPIKVRMAVPRSAKLLKKDNEGYCLYRVVVIKKLKENFIRCCQELRYTVRNFQYDPTEAAREADQKTELNAEREKLLTDLIEYSKTYFSELFSALVHLKAIRIFVESVLRYGIPINFKAYVLEPLKGYRTKLRKVLNDEYSSLSGASFTDTETEANEVTGVSGEFYAYVYVPLDVDETILAN